MSESTEMKDITIAEGFEEALAEFEKSVPRISSIIDRLYVAEFQVRPRGRADRITIQIIINPWAWPEQIPTVDVIGVEWNRPPKGVRQVPDETTKSTAMGRYRVSEKGSSLRKSWSKDQLLSDFFKSVSLWVGEYAGKMKPIPNPAQTPQAYDLLYPGGVQDLISKQKKFAQDKGLNLLDRKEERIVLRRKEQEAKLALDLAQLELRKANSEDELDSVDLSSFEGDSLEELQSIRETLREEFVEDVADKWANIVETDDDPMEQKPVGPRVRRWKEK